MVIFQSKNCSLFAQFSLDEVHSAVALPRCSVQQCNRWTSYVLIPQTQRFLPILYAIFATPIEREYGWCQGPLRLPRQSPGVSFRKNKPSQLPVSVLGAGSSVRFALVELGDF